MRRRKGLVFRRFRELKRPERLWKHLQRDIAVQLRVTGAVDLAHAAFADLGGDFIRAERGACAQGHESGLRGNDPVSRRDLLSQTHRSEKAFTRPGLYLLFRNPTGAAAAPSPIHGDLVRLYEGEEFLHAR